MTDIITFSGVHGGGKTTIINNIANRLTNIGKSVFVMQEFPYIPNIPIGTMDFQAWYNGAMAQRTKVVRKIDDMFDVILLDRHPLDVDVYTSRLLNEKVSSINIKKAIKRMHLMYKTTGRWDTKIEWKKYSMMFVLERPYEDLLTSLKIRRETEIHRKNWNEEDSEYLMHIINTFRYFKKNPNITFIENKDLDDTKDLVFEHIIQRLRQ